VKGTTLDDAAIVMAEADTVATALEDLSEGRRFELDERTVTVVEGIPFGHKFALERIEAGEPVLKYGAVIGEATRPIEAGEWVHTHNLESVRARPGKASNDARTDVAGAGSAAGSDPDGGQP